MTEPLGAPLLLLLLLPAVAANADSRDAVFANLDRQSSIVFEKATEQRTPLPALATSLGVAASNRFTAEPDSNEARRHEPERKDYEPVARIRVCASASVSKSVAYVGHKIAPISSIKNESRVALVASARAFANSTCEQRKRCIVWPFRVY